ncbi:MAG: type I-E CRISPR-associated endonuclease Cas1e [Faecalibacterium sp.]
MPKDLRSLPKLRDSLTFLYIEHAILEQDALSIVMIQKEKRTPIPIAAMTVLMIGPGVSVTHAAIKAITDNGCMVVWCGEHAARFYGYGMGETRSAQNLLMQATCCVDETRHMEVVRRMYLRRFPNVDCSTLTLQQIRGLEGVRMREAYRQMAKLHGVKWSKRSYKQEDWDAADPINRALSYANTILYSICQAAIISLGFSTGLGFVHTGKMLSFVYDIADLYKAETTIPVAFSVIGSGSIQNNEAQIRRECRFAFRRHKLLERIPKDIFWLFEQEETTTIGKTTGDLWDAEHGKIEGGINHAGEQ